MGSDRTKLMSEEFVLVVVVFALGLQSAGMTRFINRSLPGGIAAESWLRLIVGAGSTIALLSTFIWAVIFLKWWTLVAVVVAITLSLVLTVIFRIRERPVLMVRLSPFLDLVIVLVSVFLWMWKYAS
jgi:hypothetical protein